MIPTLRTITLGLAWSSALLGQNYQSSFANISYDRAKSPAGFHGDVAVDAATGAVSLDLPLGPGIGRGALKFIPRLSSRFAPTLQAHMLDATFADSPPFLWPDGRASFDAIVASTSSVRGDMLVSSSGGANLSPGYLHLKCSPVARNETQSHFTLPDGTSGSLCGDVPSGVVASNVLSAFNVSSPTLASLPRRQGEAALPSMAMGSGGELVIALAGNGGSPLSVISEAAGGTTSKWLLPARMLVIKGDIAYEFGFVHPVFLDLLVPLPRVAAKPDGKRATYLQSGYYLLTRMSNRFGESLVFNHFHHPNHLPNDLPSGYSAPAIVANGLNLDVIWARGGSAIGGVLSIRSNIGPSTHPSVYCLQGSFISQQGNTNKVTLTVSYQGMPHSSYDVEAYPTEWGTPVERNPNSRDVKESWGPSALVAGVWDHLRRNLQPIKITQSSTGDSISFAYTLAPTVSHPFVVAGTYTPTVLDSVTFPGRTVKLAWKAYPWRPNALTGDLPGFTPASPWDSPSYAFGVQSVIESASSASQRTTTYERTVPMPDWRPANAGGQGGWTNTAFFTAVTHPDGQITYTQFVEPFNPASGSTGTGTDVTDHVRTLGFLKNATQEIRHFPEGASWPGGPATRIERFDQWSIRRLGNPSGAIGKSIVPRPTRTQTWDRSNGTLTYQEADGWSSTHQDWANWTKRLYDSTAFADYQWNRTTTNSAAPAGQLFDRTHSRTLGSSFANWLPSRPSMEKTQGHPPTDITYYSASPLVKDLTVVGTDQSLTTAFTYEPGTARLSTVRLSGAGLAGSGTYGFDYGYSELGDLASIRPAGAAWAWSQTTDNLGQVGTRSDPNGLTTTYTWDDVGRLQRLEPPGELATVIAYPSSLTAQVSRGAESSEHNYDGFGQLVRTHRSSGAGLSHKRFSYDPGGRKRAETPWLPGAGSNTEGISSATAWQWNFDTRGRLESTVAPQGDARVTTRVAYADAIGSGSSQRTSTVEGDGQNPDQATTFVHDGLGRLTGVTDALGQGLSYSYDDADRILRNTFGDQTRTWGYNGLGWLTSIGQPESGTTTYSEFSVTGVPSVTTYGDGAVGVRTTFDGLMRPTSIVSTSTPSGVPAVSQSFTYDDPAVPNSKGKLTRTADGIVVLDRTYDAQGRLYRLKTSISPSGESAAAYLQTYLYDDYGRRTQATIDGRTVLTGLVAATGQASSVSHRSTTFARVTSFDTTTWLPTSLAYDRSGSRSDFQYGADQASLASLAHFPSGTGAPLRQWIYSYDSQGRLRSDNEDTWHFDSLNRLKEATFTPLMAPARAITRSFTYDAYGNVLSATGAQVGDPPALINFSFQDGDSRLLKNQIPAQSGTGATGAVYDSRGNLTAIFPKVGDSAHALGMTYDALGRVAGMTYSQGADLMQETYFYTPEGLRSRIERRRNGVLVKTEHRLYDDQRRLVAEYEAAYVAE